MYLQLSRLSETFLRFCRFTPSECPRVTQIVLLFRFESIVQRKPQDRVGAFWCGVFVSQTRSDSAVAATMGDSLLHSPECELEFCLIVGFVQGSASNAILLLPILHLDLIWTWRTALFTGVHAAAVCSQRSPRFLPCSWHQTSCPLYLSTHLLGLSESLALRGRASLFLETCHRPRYDGSGTQSRVGTPVEYLRPFTNEVQQGIHARSHRRAAGCIRQWACHVDETARRGKSTGCSGPALPRPPRRPPL